MPGARRISSSLFSAVCTSAILGSSRCVTKPPEGSTTIHSRSRSNPVSTSMAWCGEVPAHDFTG